MNAFFDKIKGYLVAIGGVILAIIGYKLIEQNNEIKTLELDKAQSEAENAIKVKEGELNEVKKQTEAAETKSNTSNSNYESAKSELDKLRGNRPT